MSFALEKGCYYASAWGQAFAWTQLVPYIVSIGLTLLAVVTNQFMYWALGWYLHGVQLLLWFVQLNLQIDRPNPLCQEYHTYAFPSIEAYYIGAVVTFIIVYSRVWKTGLSLYVWAILVATTVIPPIILVFLAYNQWYEVLISMAVGAVASIVIIIMFWVYIYDALPYIQNVFPFSWAHFQDSYIWTNSEKEHEKVERIRRCLAKHG